MNGVSIALRENVTRSQAVPFAFFPIPDPSTERQHKHTVRCRAVEAHSRGAGGLAHGGGLCEVVFPGERNEALALALARALPSTEKAAGCCCLGWKSQVMIRISKPRRNPPHKGSDESKEIIPNRNGGSGGISYDEL